MRLPYVLILLAVATRPVDVGAHADPSDIVTIDGRVQRHLRVPEPTPDKDNDERTFPSVEEIVSPNAIDKAADMLDLTILDYDLSDASYNAMSNLSDRKRSADETLKSAKKRMKKEFTLDVEAVADMVWARSQNMQGEGPVKSFGEIMSKSNEIPKDRLARSINTLLLKGNKTPQEVFELYQLNLALKTLFRQIQLEYWVNYLDAYNNKMSTEESLLDILRMYYDDTALVVVMANASQRRVTIATMVDKELKDSWIKAQVTPVDAFNRLNLKEDVKNSALASFWVKYFVYYNDHVETNAKVSVASAVSLLEQPYLLNFFKFIRKSESTTELEKEVKDMQLKIWNDDNISNKEIRRTVNKIRAGKSVYAYAAKKAQQEHQKLQILLRELLQR